MAWWGFSCLSFLSLLPCSLSFPCSSRCRQGQQAVIKLCHQLEGFNSRVPQIKKKKQKKNTSLLQSFAKHLQQNLCGASLTPGGQKLAVRLEHKMDLGVGGGGQELSEDWREWVTRVQSCRSCCQPQLSRKTLTCTLTITRHSTRHRLLKAHACTLKLHYVPYFVFNIFFCFQLIFLNVCVNLERPSRSQFFFILYRSQPLGGMCALCYMEIPIHEQLFSNIILLQDDANAGAVLRSKSFTG